MTMPQRGESGQPWETGPQPGATGQPGAAGQPGTGQPGAGQPGAGQPGAGQPYPPGPPGYPQGSAFGNAPQGSPRGGYGGEMSGQPISPVNEIETRVTGRRIVQYIVDAILFGIIAGLVSWALNRGHGGVHALLYLILIVFDVLWYTLYWALRPFSHAGQTLGMQLMGLRVIGQDGGVASFLQLFVRSILLVLFTPLSLIVGIITMMFSRYRQRVGDHMARTMVVRSSVEPLGAAREYAGAGQAGSR
jgi:uncharacterized RDD family membrane protein YckC